MSDDKISPPKQTDRRRTTGSWAVEGYMVRFPSQRFNPPTDIIELDNQIVILIEIAGMRSDGFKIALDHQSLMISGTRQRPEFDDAAYHQAEIGFGDFRLTIPMPWSIDRENVAATYRSGFLRIELPRLQMRRVQIVDVSEEDDENEENEA